MILSILACLSSLLTLVLCEQTWQIPVEHTWAKDDNHWTRRGEVHLFSSLVDHTLIGRYMHDTTLSQEEKKSLVDAANNEGSYRIRCAINLDKADARINSNDYSTYAMGHTDARRLAQSNLQEVLLVSIDSQKRRLLSITPLPVVMNYDHQYAPLVQELTADSFNTSIRVIDLVEGPTPDTQSYIQRVEQEKRQQTQTGGEDNRSFIAKYWMYIVPVVIFLLVSGAMGPEGGS